MISKKSGIGTLILILILVSTLLVPVVNGKTDSISLKSDDREKTKVTKLPDMELKVININNTSNIVQAGVTL